MNTDLDTLDPTTWYYFVAWSDYDGPNLVSFESRQAAEQYCDDLTLNHRGDYGLSFEGVIYGRPMKMKIVERVKQIEFE